MAGTLHLDHKLIALVILLLTLGVTNASNTYPTRFAFTPPELEVSYSMMKVELIQGEIEAVQLQIRNTGSPPPSVTIDSKDQDKDIFVTEPSFTLDAFDKRNVTLIFAASSKQRPESYRGTIIVRSEYDQKRIITLTEVRERKPVFDISVKVPEEFKHVQQGSQVEADIMVHNSGDLMLVDVFVTYGIKDSDGNVVARRQETFAVKEQKGIRRQFKVPEDLKPDVYISYALLEYEGQKTESTDTFEITGEIIEEKHSLWNVVEKYKTAFIVGIMDLILFVIILVWPVKGGKREGNRKASRLRSL